MVKYVCSSKDSNAWSISSQDVALQTFHTEEEAILWFQHQYPDKNLVFSGYEFDGNYLKNYVYNNDIELGYINKYSF
ncbi:hypothetical protein [Nostoc sp. TCL26-01]|uniref:hypothetical protein n=1 Tax=Nostoc sp. TCL26-01 TaxID=2576904 RepID=UPI0015BF7FCF|nr:hypothetical protein [Nostoc sp. TCL26-01]QLE59616.1 hypothetical protein FD725_29605 [Nostoc sp. TCL26-01]